MKRFHARVLMVFMMSFSAMAQPPTLIHYQGRLVDGTNLVNGMVSMAFRIHDDPVVKSVLFEATNWVQVVDGLYSTVIGEYVIQGTLDEALSVPEAWLEVLIDFEPLLPRERITAVAYARRVPGFDVRGTLTAVGNADFGLHDVHSNAVRGVVGGGFQQQIGDTQQATVSGGRGNRVLDDADHGVIGGGFSNTVSGAAGMVPGGDRNEAGLLAFAAGRRAKATHQGSFVWGDATDADVASTSDNQVTFRADGGFRVLGGAIEGDASGLSNFPPSVVLNVATGGGGAIAFSTNNQALATGAAVLGGAGNSVTNGSTYSTVGGGENNRIRDVATHATIAGGRDNLVDINASGAFVGGGSFNHALSPHSVVVGGYENTVQAFSSNAVIAGGHGNVIHPNAEAANVSGGSRNRIEAGAVASSIGGGQTNTVAATYAVISGGRQNAIDAFATYGVIGGGQQNVVASNAIFATVGGGWTNRASGGYATIGGGLRNLADGADSTIGGGHINRAGGFRSTVPGGSLNEAMGDYSLAAGRRARANHAGAFVWADSADADFSSSSSNQFLIRAGGGVGIGVANPSAALQVDAPAGSEPMRVRLDGATKLWVRDNGGTAVGGFAAAPANGLYVAGNTGLGVTNPIERLHIEGGLHIVNTVRDISVPPAENLQIGQYDGTNFTERMRITTNGLVQIQEDLTVEGTINHPLVPIAAGLVRDTTGTVSLVSSVGNVFVGRLVGTDYYDIELIGINLNDNYIVLLTPKTSGVDSARYEYGAGRIRAYFRHTDNTYPPTTFAFVVYKLVP